MPIWDVTVTFPPDISDRVVLDEIPRRFRVVRVGSANEYVVECHTRDEADMVKIGVECIRGVHAAIPDTPSRRGDPTVGVGGDHFKCGITPDCLCVKEDK